MCSPFCVVQKRERAVVLRNRDDVGVCDYWDLEKVTSLGRKRKHPFENGYW